MASFVIAATWGSIVGGDDAEVILNSPADEYISLVNGVTFNASANVTNGAYLTNMSLWTNESGTWESKNTTTEPFDSGILHYNSTGTTVGAMEYLTRYNYSYNKMNISDIDLDMFGGGINDYRVSCFMYFLYTDDTNENTSIQTQIAESWVTKTFTNPNTAKLVKNTQTICSIFDPIKVTSPASIRNFTISGKNITGYSTRTFDRTITEPTLWNIEACDSNGDCGFATDNRTLFIDITKPQINVSYPTGIIDYGAIGNNETLNITFTDANLNSCWYNYNGTNVSIPGCLNGVLNSTTLILENNKLNITIYANDSIGNTNSTFKGWNYKFLENSQTNSDTATVGSIEDFTLNATIGSGYDLSSASLIYGGNTLSPSITSSGSNRIITVSDYEIPFYAVDTNVSFYWVISLDDSTTFNTSIMTMLVSPVNIDNCSTYTNQIFNISLFDEETKNSITGDVELSYSIINPDTYTTISTLYYEATDINSTLVCSQGNLSEEGLLYSTEIRYSSDDHVSELYNIQRSEIVDYSQNINLYNLAENDSTTFKVTYQDSTFNFVEGAIVQLQRKYISEGIYRTVEAPLTSNDGISALHIDLDSILYRATVVKNGIVLDEFDNLVFQCQSELTGECEKKLLGTIDPQNDINLDITRDFSYSINKNSSIITLSFTIPSGVPSNVNMLLVQKDQFGDSYVCNNTILSSAGSVQCTISPTLGDSYIDLSIFKNGYPMATLTYVVGEERGLAWLGNNYIFIIILLFSIMGMALSSPEWIVINAIIVFVISGALYLANGLDFVMGLGNLVWLIIAAIILISKISKQEDR